MRITTLSIAAVILGTVPAMADGDGVPGDAPYTGPTYQREVHTYEREYRTVPPRVVVAPPVVAAPVVTETVIVRRPVVVIPPPPVAVEAYPVYPAPRVYAYGAYPIRRWGPPHLYGRW
jgi:hypothetical protein